MKKLVYSLALVVGLSGCKSTQKTVTEEEPILASLDLVNVQDDKVMVTIDPDKFTTETTVFNIPKVVPGTYSTSDFGKFTEDFTAYDYKGNELEVIQVSPSSWSIPNAEDLDKITYWVNDTFDQPDGGGIYSMGGTNILEDKNFLLNLFGFVGYFDQMKEEPYRLEIKRPSHLIAGSALTVDQTLSAESEEVKTDVYLLDRYFEVTDNPIMYASPDTTSFEVEGMEVLLDVYSPNDSYSSQELKPVMEKMVAAQKKFLGELNTTDKYAILLYLAATPGENDAGNFGALEHHTSTVVVMPETMSDDALNQNMTDIVSHEFFHILTPLNVHSEEIHFFDYNDPKMSKHLWMYEGVTEYFANLFQVNQGLIENQEFYDRMYEKVLNSKNYSDTLPFTEMSENILEEKYGKEYANVYQKGALIGMALDIRLRELSEGQYGILDLMKELSEKYGKNKPFKDEELIPTIVALTYPEIKEFFDLYVSGSTPIPYDQFFEKVGLRIQEGEVPVDFFIKDQTTPYITLNAAGNVLLRNDLELNSFLKESGLKPGDVIKSINGTVYSAQNVYDLIAASENWKEGETLTMSIIRDGEELELEAVVSQPMAQGMRLVEIPGASSTQIELRHAWLKS